MSESKFTPAPWEIHERYNGLLDIGKLDAFDDETRCNEVIAHAIDTEANATLILTAPEMYNILQSMAENDFELTESMCLEARRVIKKATGK